MAKVTRHNDPLLAEARRMAYQAGHAEGFVKGREYGRNEKIEVQDQAVENLKKHYSTIISNLDKQTNNQFELIKISVDESQDMHFVSSISICYVHSGNLYGGEIRYAPGHKFTVEEVVECVNALLEQMILSHKQEVDNG